ncbi:MAG: lactate racemase domain-containing protein [Sedimentisphaerales bacterium]|nr:lactate racemase domain-containing protein [Sedimentisphaerales bacterium]
MQVDLHYGRGVITLQIPRKNVSDIIRPQQDKGNTDNVTLVSQALACQEKDDFVKEAAGKCLCVLLADGTRDMPLNDILGQLFPLLGSSSLVRFLICTGTHNAETIENSKIKEQIETAATEARFGDFEIHVHDCQKDRFIQAGRTSRGTEVMFNAKADKAQIFLVLSDIKCHYFAGYSNPIKNFVPGICAFRTAEQNHSLALDNKSTFALHPWHRDENRKGNPLAEDQLEGMRLIVKNRPVYALVTISSLGRIQWVRFGQAEEVSRAAFSVADEMNTHTVKPVEYLVVSPGGLPNDIDLYNAQRALELTKNAVKDGGEILFLSACPNGVGAERTRENFYNRLTAPIDKILKSVESEYKLFSHKAYKFAQMIKRLRRIWMFSEIPDELVEAIHLRVTHKPQTVVDNWLAENPNTKITAVDGANKVALYAAQSFQKRV